MDRLNQLERTRIGCSQHETFLTSLLTYDFLLLLFNGNCAFMYGLKKLRKITPLIANGNVKPATDDS